MTKEKIMISIESPAIIIPKKTGVTYFNQVGGYSCHDLEIEGFVIPVAENFYWKSEDGKGNVPGNEYWNYKSFQKHMDELFAPLGRKKTKYKGHGYNGIDEEDAKYIEKCFKSADYCELKVDRNKLDKCQEAAIYVKVNIPNFKVVEGRYVEQPERDFDGILTWRNSD